MNCTPIIRLLLLPVYCIQYVYSEKVAGAVEPGQIWVCNYKNDGKH